MRNDAQSTLKCVIYTETCGALSQYMHGASTVHIDFIPWDGMHRASRSQGRIQPNLETRQDQLDVISVV